MKRILLLVMAATVCLGAKASDDTPLITPTETCLFAHRDTCDLYLDIYEPAPGAETTFQGVRLRRRFHNRQAR